MMRAHRRSTVLAAAAATLACSSEHPSAPSQDAPPVAVAAVAPTDAPAPAPACVVASGTDFTITIADVELMRRYFTPSPALEPATRLAVDVWLAEWQHTSLIGDASMSERVGYHRNAVGNSERWLRERAQAAEAVALEHGPCYVPLTPNAG